MNKIEDNRTPKQTRVAYTMNDLIKYVGRDLNG